MFTVITRFLRRDTVVASIEREMANKLFFYYLTLSLFCSINLTRDEYIGVAAIVGSLERASLTHLH